MMRILAIISAEYGKRHVDNLRAHAPQNWQIEILQAPLILPPVIDYPEDYLPAEFPPADLLLSFAEHRGVAELLPDIARLCGASAAIVPVDNEAWLPRGLARQLRGWMEDIQIVCVTPKPLCSLTESEYWVTRRQRIQYDQPLIAEFARHFGKPRFDVKVDPETRTIQQIEVQRDSFCGCARYVAEQLIGCPVDEAPEKTGLLHHHYPCWASMGIDPDFSDTLMHVSGNIFKDEISEQIKPYRQINYLVPGSSSPESGDTTDQ